jgi:hypothetical protein
MRLYKIFLLFMIFSVLVVFSNQIYVDFYEAPTDITAGVSAKSSGFVIVRPPNVCGDGVCISQEIGGGCFSDCGVNALNFSIMGIISIAISAMIFMLYTYRKSKKSKENGYP